MAYVKMSCVSLLFLCVFMQINFYILPPTKKLLNFVCQLIQTIIAKSQDSVMILANTTTVASLDALLWSFDPVSFIPHEVLTSHHHENIAKSPVILTDNAQFLQNFDGIVINLTEQTFVDLKANKLLEIVDSDPALTAQGRVKYQFYQSTLPHFALQIFQIK